MMPFLRFLLGVALACGMATIVVYLGCVASDAWARSRRRRRAAKPRMVELSRCPGCKGRVGVRCWCTSRTSRGIA